MKKVTRALSLILAAATLSTVSAGPVLATESSAQTVDISVAYHPNMHGGAPMAIAEAEGYFAAEGLNVEPVRFTSGAPELDAMIAGELDVGYLGPGALPAVMRGEVELLTLSHPSATEFVLASEASGIETPADLEGKEVLVAFGTSGELVLREALKTAGLAWEDITPVNSPDESSLTAYTAGTADVISVGPTFTSSAREQVPSNDVFTSSDSQDFALPGVWIANKEFVVENRELADRFLRAIGEANDYRYENLQDIVPLVSDYTGTPAADLQSQVDLTDWWTTQQIIEAIEGGEVNAMLEGLNARFEETGKMDQMAPVENYFNGEATVRAYTTESEGEVTRVSDTQFPWVPTFIGLILLAVLVAIGLIIRRARA